MPFQNTGDQLTFSATCPAGKTVLGGGYRLFVYDGPVTGQFPAGGQLTVGESRPSDTGTG